MKIRYARVIRNNGQNYILCYDGSVAEATPAMLLRLFTGFRNAEELHGNWGDWTVFAHSMEGVGGETLAFVSDRHLLVETIVHSKLITPKHPIKLYRN